MLKRFEKILETFPKKGKKLNVLVAISGGVDSTVLAHLCKTCDINFALAHCNFNLRADESDEDQEFVEDLAEELGVSLFFHSFDTVEAAEERSKSIQLTARELRYGWFEELVTKYNFDFLFSAHHLNDRVETTIFNFLRGGGVSGLRSIQEINKYIARPLISFTRKDIELYAILNNIAWREDSSNKNTKYTRNYIRHEIIPRFDDVHENWEKAIENSYTRLEQSEAILKDLAYTIHLNLEFQDFTVDQFMTAVRKPVLLEYALKKYGFTFPQCQDFFRKIKSNTPYASIKSGNYNLVLDRGLIKLIKKATSSQETLILTKPSDEASGETFHIATSIIQRDVFEIQQDVNNAYFDLKNIEFPISISTWQEGDYFVPFGMRGKKKISDFFIDQKIPKHLKSIIPILKDANGEVIWIAGHRQSNKFKITKKTNKVLIFHLI